MKALTLIQPWAWAVVHAGKRVENRKWAPPRNLVDQVLGIHAGKRYDVDAQRWIERNFGIHVPGPDAVPLGALVATTVVRRPVFTRGALPQAQQPWWMGPIGWPLEHLVPIEPFPMRGAQGLWEVPAGVLEYLQPLEGGEDFLEAITGQLETVAQGLRR